jgi:putative endonuclease
LPYLYILECSDGTYYTGSTWNLEKRILEHNEGIGARYTSKRIPVKIVYFEEYEMVKDAFSREKQIQAWSHIKKKALIEGKIDLLHIKAKKNFKK